VKTNDSESTTGAEERIAKREIPAQELSKTQIWKHVIFNLSPLHNLTK